MSSSLLSIRNLTTSIGKGDGAVVPVVDVSIDIKTAMLVAILVHHELDPRWKQKTRRIKDLLKTILQAGTVC